MLHYDPEASVKVVSDASAFRIGGYLKQPAGIVGRFSRQLSEAEKRYSTTERELLGIVIMVKKFDRYLYGRPFVIITDHKPLLGILDPLKKD